MLLASHFGALLFCVGLGGDSDAGYGDFLRDDRVYGAGETNLHRASDLTTVKSTLYKRCHYRAESTDIIIICAHIVAQFAVYFFIVLFAALRSSEMPRAVIAALSLLLRGTPSLMYMR